MFLDIPVLSCSKVTCHGSFWARKIVRRSQYRRYVMKWPPNLIPFNYAYTTNFVATRESIFRRAHLLFSRLQDNVNWKTDSQLMLSGAVKQGKLSGAVNLKKTWIFKFDSRQHRCKAKPLAYDGPLAAKEISRGQNSRFRERKVARKPDASFPAQTELRV